MRKSLLTQSFLLPVVFCAGSRCKTALLLTLFLLNACGPVYENVYSFSPPSSAAGKACIIGCENSRNFCEQSEYTRVQNCKSSFQISFDACKQRNATREAQMGVHSTPYIEYCNPIDQCRSANLERCSASYRNCFSGCGGTVSVNRRCKRFCN
jgi:hypothetical protein